MPPKIYIIEDDVNLLYSLQAKFSVEGFRVIINDGSSEEKAIGEIVRIKPDFVILDLILPKIDGFNLLKDIKSRTELSNTVVFIFTNLSDEDSRARCSDLGADHFLVKADFPLDDFVNKIKKIIENKRKV